MMYLWNWRRVVVITTTGIYSQNNCEHDYRLETQANSRHGKEEPKKEQERMMIVDHRDSVFLEFGIVHFDRWHRTERTDGRAARIRKLDQFNSFLRFCSRPPPPWQSRKKKDRIPPFCAMNRLSIANNKLKFVSKGMQPPFHDVWCSHGMISYQGWADGRRTVCKHARSLLTASFRNHWSKNITMLQQGGESEKKSRTGTETSAVFLVSLPSLSSLFALLFASWQVRLSFCSLIVTWRHWSCSFAQTVLWQSKRA